MAKAKLKILKTDFPKFSCAAEWVDIKTGDSRGMGDSVQVEVSTRDLSRLVELGRTMEKLSAADVDLFVKEKMKAKAEVEKASKK